MVYDRSVTGEAPSSPGFPSPALTFLRPTTALVPKTLAAEDHFRDGKFQSFESTRLLQGKAVAPPHSCTSISRSCVTVPLVESA